MLPAGSSGERPASARERRLSLGCVFTPPCSCRSLLYALIDDPRRCKWRGGTLRHLGQNSLGLYIISEVIGDLLDSFCVGGTDHHHCSDNINFKRDVQHFFRHVGGSEENEVRRRPQASPPRTELARGAAQVPLFAAANVVFIMLVAWYFERAGIMIKL